jgi:hypothetical protein
MSGELALIAGALALLCVVAVALAAVIRRDGRGRRTPPSSRRSWEVGTTVEQVR